MFGHIVPCGIAGKEVTSLEAEGVAGGHGRGGGGGLRRGDGAVGGGEARRAPGRGHAGGDEGRVGVDAGHCAGGLSGAGRRLWPRGSGCPGCGPELPAGPLLPGRGPEAAAAAQDAHGGSGAPTVAPEAPVAPGSAALKARSGCRRGNWSRSDAKITSKRDQKRPAHPKPPRSARRQHRTWWRHRSQPSPAPVLARLRLPTYRLPTYRLPTYRLPTYRLPTYRLPTTGSRRSRPPRPVPTPRPLRPPPPPAAPARPVRLLGRLGKLVEAGVDPAGALPLEARKPPWLRANAHMGTEFRSLRKTVRGLGLVTVCEEAGCPNIFECWADGTATFMINGDRCTRACGFCQVNTAKPLPLDPDEPEKVAEAVARLGLAHAVVTCVARDDLEDGGASGFAATIDAIRRRCPGTAVEVLISDCKGDPAALGRIFEQRPDVLNHNIETVPRLQRAVRPSASYARSLAVLARARDAGLTTKSGLMLGLGETEEEVVGVLADLQAIGVSIVTIGQYLRPSANHLPVARWWSPEDFARIAEAGRALGIPQVVASPLTRSSYHARQAAAGAVGAACAATGQVAATERSGGADKDATSTSSAAATAAAIAASSRAEAAGGAA